VELGIFCVIVISAAFTLLLKSRSRNIYYRCSSSKGKCELPYLREEELSERLGQVLKDIHIPDNVLAQLENSLMTAR